MIDADELTFDLTPTQADAVRRYVDRRERALIEHLNECARRGSGVTLPAWLSAPPSRGPR